MIRILKKEQKIIRNNISFGISRQKTVQEIVKEKNQELKNDKKYLEKLKNFKDRDNIKEQENNYAVDSQLIEQIQNDLMENRYGFIFDNFLDSQEYDDLTIVKKQQRLKKELHIQDKIDLLKAELNYKSVKEEVTLDNQMNKRKIKVPHDYEDEDERELQLLDQNKKSIKQSLREDGIRVDENLQVIQDENELDENQDQKELDENQDQKELDEDKLNENQEKLNENQDKLDENQDKLDENQENLQEILFEDQDKLNEEQDKLDENQDKLDKDQDKLDENQENSQEILFEEQEYALEIDEINEQLNPDENLKLAIQKQVGEYLEKKTGKTLDQVLELLEKNPKLKITNLDKQAEEEQSVEEQKNDEQEEMKQKNKFNEDQYELDYVNFRDIEIADTNDYNNEFNLSVLMYIDEDQPFEYPLGGTKKFLIEINKAKCQPFQRSDHFKKFILQKEVQSLIYLLFQKRIYINDNNYVTNQQISQLMQLYDKDKCYNQSLDLIKFHYQFVNADQKTQLFSGYQQCINFLAKYSKSRDFNYLSFSFHLIRLCQYNIMEKVDQDDLINQFLRISVDGNQKFYDMHKDLLFNQYMIQKNDALRYFIFDTFYSAKNYEIGILQYLITIQILARIQQKQSCQDLLQLAQKIFSNKFQNLFNNILPSILRQLPNRDIYQAYMNKNKKNNSQIMTYFDKIILKNISNVQIIFDQNVDEDYQKSQNIQIKYQDSNNHNQLLHFRKNEPQYKYGYRSHYLNMMNNNDEAELFQILNDYFKSQEYSPCYNLDNSDPKKGLQFLYDKFYHHLDYMEKTGVQFDEYFQEQNDIEEQLDNPYKQDLPDYESLEDKINVQSTIVEQDLLMPEVKMIKKGFQDKKLDELVKNQIDKLNKKKNNLLNKSYANFCTDNKQNDDNKFKQFLQKQKEIDMNTKLTMNEVEQLKEQLQIKSQVQVPKVDVNEVDNLLKNISDFQEQQQAIMKQLETKTLQNQTSEQIQRFIQQMIKNYKELLIHMFFNQESAFSKYPLPAQAYTQLLNDLKINYTRNSFRHVLNHFSRANIKLNQEKIQLVFQMSNLLIEKNQRTVYLELVRQDEIINDEQIVIHLVGGLSKFSDTRNEIADLIKRYLNLNENAKLKIDLIKEFIQSQKQKNDYQEIMILFEQIKDNIQSRKPKYDKSTPSDQIMIIQRQFKESMAKQMHLFYQDFIELLNKEKKIKEAQILFQDMMNQKYEIEERDFINGFQCNQDNAVMTVKIFTAVETYKKEMIDKNFFKIISQNIIANSLYMHDLFEKIVREYIMTDKNLDLEIIAITLKMFEALPMGSLFADFLKVILAQYILLTERQKIQCYNVLQTCQDNNSKSFIKGLINQIFDQDRIKKINKYKKRQDGQEILNSMFQEKVEREIVEFDGWNDLMKLYAKPYAAIMARGKNKRKRFDYEAKTYLEFISFDEELDCKQLREKHK